MSQFKHFLITRFNVRLGANYEVEDPWMVHRLELFKLFCMPGVQEQTCRNFTWLVFFDEDTPEIFRDTIQDMAKAGEFTPVYCTAFHSALRQTVQDLVSPSTTHIISSRLDNDDTLARDFVQTVQNQFEGQPFCFIDLPNGCQLCQGKLYLKRFYSNPFLSLIEETKDLITVMCGPHQDRIKYGPSKAVLTAPMWLQVIHEKNIYNALKKGDHLRLPPTTLEVHFPISPDTAQLIDEGEERIQQERRSQRWGFHTWNLLRNLRYAILRQAGARKSKAELERE